MSQTPARIHNQPTTAWLISAATATDTVIALNTIKAIGWTGMINTSNWSINLQRNGSKDAYIGYNGWWIVSDGIHVDLLSNADYIATYTNNVPMAWPATTTAPVMVPLTGQQATLCCAPPTSANGPWTYTIALTDTTAQTTTELTEAPTLTDGQLSWTLNDLTPGDEYTAEITVTTQYEGVEATSLPSEPITAVA